MTGQNTNSRENLAKFLPSKYRQLQKGWKLASVSFPLFAILLSFLQIFHLMPGRMMLYNSSFLYLLLSFLLPVAFLWIPLNASAPKNKIPWYDILLAVLSILIPIYFVSQQRTISVMGWDQGAPTIPFIGCVILWILLIEAARRAVGKAMAIILVAFSIYPFLAPYMPGFLWSPGFSFRHMASFHIFGQDSVMGAIFNIFGTLILGYMLFGAVMQIFGAGLFFNNICMSLMGTTRASNSKVAIFASALFATVSGSPISNVMTTGTFTIPAMKKEGLPAYFAGAVEAAASAGGVLVPPVMGAVAFIMAEYLQVSYADVCIAAAVPAALYYITLFAQIDCYAARIGLKPSTVAFDVPPVWKTILNNLHIILGFIVLIAVLFIWRLVAQAPWLAVGAMIVASFIKKGSRLKLRDYVTLVENAGRMLAELLSILAPIGLILGSLVLTGAAYKFPNAFVDLARGSALLMLIFGAIASFVLGMGVTSAAAYIFLAIVLGPAMAHTGLDLMAIHMFIFYWAILSNITPPVAIAAFAAASVAQSDPMKTGYTAMMLGVAKYILPFVFVYEPALIMHGSFINIVVTVATAAAGLLIIGCALEGYLWFVGILTKKSRILFFCIGMLLVIPSRSMSILGLITFLLIFIAAWRLRGRSNILSKSIININMEKG